MIARSSRLAAALTIVLGLASAPAAPADNDNGSRYEVSITNLTRGQQFTPILALSHKDTVRLFTLGQPSSSELAILAKEGATDPLRIALSNTPGTGPVVTGNGLTQPGATTTLVVEGGRRGMDRLSVASMLIPTNDAFFALNGVELPRGNDTLTLLVPAYDAGAEKNDELCGSIPGPSFVECGGSGGGANVGGGEGFVHVHGGIQGVGELHKALRDWRNPVALISVRRVR